MTNDDQSQDKQLMTLVHEEMSQFFDVVNEKEMKEVADRYPNSRYVPSFQMLKSDGYRGVLEGASWDEQKSDFS